MSYKLKEIIYNADGYYPVYENDDYDETYKEDKNKKNNIKDYKIKIINTKTDESNSIYTYDNIKDYMHR